MNKHRLLLSFNVLVGQPEMKKNLSAQSREVKWARIAAPHLFCEGF